jgi:outer membrane protein OmpA-like peptidoglycan-associated protein
MMFILRILLFYILLIVTLPTNAACNDYQSQVNRAIGANDLTKLERLLPKLRYCPSSYIDAVKRSMSDIAAAKADRLVQQGRLAAAENWLKRAKALTWGTQVVRGEIAVRRQDWQNASVFYNQTLDLINDKQATPQAPPKAQIETIFKQAEEAQMLSGRIITISRSGRGTGMMRGKIRGFIPRKRVIPIPFDSGDKWIVKLDDNAKKVIKYLADYIIYKEFKQITLTGHTDENYISMYNNWLSKRRAEVVKTHLQELNVQAKIKTIGKGEDEPRQLVNRKYYTKEQIDMFNRRVELSDMKK